MAPPPRSPYIPVKVCLPGRIALFCLLAVSAAAAGSLEYTLDLPASDSISYVVEFEVREPGQVVVDAAWSSARILTLKLDPPGAAAERRTGPSPQKLTLEVRPAALREDEKWVLSIHGLPARQAGTGTLTITVPEARAEVASGLEQQSTEKVPPPRNPWEIPRQAPPGASLAVLNLFGATERMRHTLLGTAPPAPDACHWQSDLLRYLALARDSLSDSGSGPAADTLRMLTRMSGAVGQVESFRVSEDPLLVPPDSDDRAQRRVWQVIFGHQTAPLRSTLDVLLHDLEDQRAPELESQEWPLRFMSCLIACERFFEEQRSRGGATATNRKLADDQWERILVAGDALDALAKAGSSGE